MLKRYVIRIPLTSTIPALPLDEIKALGETGTCNDRQALVEAEEDAMTAFAAKYPDFIVEPITHRAAS